MKRLSLLTLIAVIALAALAMASDQQQSGTQTVTVNITVPESITLSLSGGPVTLPPNGTASNTITMTYSYALVAANHSTGVWNVAWFSSSTAALSGAGNIPSSAISLQTDSSAYAACNGAAAYGVTVANATCVAHQSINQPGLVASPTATGFSDTLNLEYTGGALNAGNYSGTLSVMYVAP